MRYPATHQQHIKVRNGEVYHLSPTIDRAIGVRVLVGNGWGFAASRDVSEESIRRTGARALEGAAARNLASTQAGTLSDIPQYVARWESPYAIDPWSVPIAKKLEHLMNATEPMRGDEHTSELQSRVDISYAVFCL